MILYLDICLIIELSTEVQLQTWISTYVIHCPALVYTANSIQFLVESVGHSRVEDITTTIHMDKSQYDKSCTKYEGFECEIRSLIWESDRLHLTQWQTLRNINYVKLLCKP